MIHFPGGIFMFVDFDFQPRYEDYNKNGALKLSTMLKIFEAASTKHSDIAKDDILADTENGKAWVLTDWYLTVDKYPVCHQKLSSKTWTEPLSQILFSTRNYQLFADGEPAVRCMSRWIILDLATNRPHKFEKSFLENYEPEDARLFEDSKFPKFETPESFISEKEIILRRSDIDYNDHVHNLTYLDYAMEALPQDVYEKQNFKNLHICYKLAVKPGEKIVCKYTKIQNKHLCFIYDTQGQLRTQIQFEE